ncbi:uncharacterized protein LOC134240393 [Saccostrea cucullata]|uniref:uncharacterized protein LOC134240393 n=1 Tax=Saccostrea cuccullata TaxID=36930 RepID=UPI002ED2262F
MYAFVTECLVQGSDLKFFMTTASRDVISEYCRSWGYERSEGERCLYIPERPDGMYDLFIEKLQLDIIIHCTMSDKNIHNQIKSYLKIPEEVMKWDIDARKRFVEISKQGSKNMCRARGMIVGCAGAGKTTLLRQLQRTQKSDCPSSTETTIGLEIHEDLFEVKDDTLIDLNSKTENKEDGSQDKQIISMTDFAGQVAYYACHQIYLSRRAFYLVVMDMSKRLDEVVHTQDTDRHYPKGSLFHGWAYKDYFLFWLRSIKTYCEDRNRQEAINSPVIIIASHHDCVKEKQQIDSANSFYNKFEKCLPEEQTLKGLISKTRYYEVECPEKINLNEHQAEMIENVRKCIVRTAQNLSHWGEKIPIKWTMFEHLLRENKRKTMKILSRNELHRKKEFKSLDEFEISDMLRYFKEIGLIIYFAEEGLKENIIIDVQWFVDAFKNIITDPTHVEPFCERVKEWEIFMKTGRISDQTLVKIWGENSFYVSTKDIIIPYMEKLGILAIVRKEEDARKKLGAMKMRPVYYIPSINKTDYTKKCREITVHVNKTPVLAFSFKTYIPHFFFFRLVALCFSVWDPLREDLLCKNVAFYKDKGGDRNIAIGVNKTSIQLQVFTPDKTIQLTHDKTKEIRATIEKMINEITCTFHHHVLYEVGYPCKDIDITDEDEDCFLSEREVAQLSTNKRICPNNLSRKNHENHEIVRDDLLYYWYTVSNLHNKVKKKISKF